MRILHLLVVASALALAACGGDPKTVDPVEPSGDVPASAAASSESYTQYVQARPADDDTSEPLGLSRFAEAPTTDTGSPVDFD